MKKLLSAALLAASALILGFPISAHATTYSKYTDPTVFLAATPSGASVYDFTNSLSGASTGTLGPVTITDDGANGLSTSSDSTYGSGVTYLTSTSSSITFAADDAHALGFWFSTDGSDGVVRFQLEDFSSKTIAVTGSGNVQFIGFVTSADISDVTFTGYGGNIAFTAIATDSPFTTEVAPTPEPSSIALFGTGVLGIGGMVRRRFQRA